jgi:hypothetical protein
MNELAKVEKFRYQVAIAQILDDCEKLEKANKDGSTFLRAFNLMGMPHNIILAKKENFKELAQIR